MTDQTEAGACLMAERVLPSRLYRIDRDMGEIAWAEEKDTALDDVERAIRMGVLIPVNHLQRSCNCGQCGINHSSGCAVHNEPAYGRGKCNCVPDGGV